MQNQAIAAYEYQVKDYNSVLVPIETQPKTLTFQYTLEVGEKHEVHQSYFPGFLREVYKDETGRYFALQESPEMGVYYRLLKNESEYAIGIYMSNTRCNRYAR